MDLNGAYTLLSFRPEDAGLLGMLLIGDLIYLQIDRWNIRMGRYSHSFPSSHEGHNVGASTRSTEQYSVGLCFAEDVDQDLAKTLEVCTSLLGSGKKRS